MKKSNTNAIIAIIVIILILIVAFVWKSNSSAPTTPSNPQTTNTNTQPTTPVVPVSQTSVVSSKLSSYENDELGFSLKYPTAWEKDENDTGVVFIMPIDTTQVSTVAKLEADVVAAPSKCAFPPVATVKDRGTLTVAGQTMNMISLANTVQGRTYNNRIYTLQKGSICYSFSFSAISQDPTVKGLTGSSITQAQNNNKAIMSTADAAFTDMVKTFAFVSSAKGIDETKAPVK